MTLPSGRARIYALAILGLIVLRLVAAAVLPLSADEAYYWLWSRHLGPGYFDHPPAIAWAIRFGTLLFRDSELGVRFGPIVLSVIASWFVWRTGAILLEDEEGGALSALLFNLTLMIGIETLAATPDAPAVATSAAFLYALAKVERTQDGRWWIAAGIAAGLALLSKYTAFFLGLGALAWLAFAPDARRWFLSPWIYAGGALAGAIFLPNLLWNATHGWETFVFQFSRVETGGFTLRFLFEFLAAQLLLATPFVFVLGAAGIAIAWSSPRTKLLTAIIAPSIVYFVVHALHDRVQGNWPSFLFPAFAIAAALAWRTDWGGRLGPVMGVVRGLAIPVAAILLLAAYAQALFGVVPMGRKDPLSRLLAVGFGDVARAVDQTRTRIGAAAVVTTDYASTGWLTFYLPRTDPVVPIVEPWRWAMAPRVPAALLSRPLLYVVENRNDRRDVVAAMFRDVVPEGTVLRRHGKAPVAVYDLYRVGGPRGPVMGWTP
jgi:4-amino-4-deoxy-L-arabinose transferase-like glycosyltransferase